MDTVCIVFGEWKIGMPWQFAVDVRKGAKLLCVDDDCGYTAITQIIKEEFHLPDTEKVVLLYLLPPRLMSKMPEDTPPVFITNDRQLQLFLRLCKTEVLRLCVVCDGCERNCKGDLPAEETVHAPDEILVGISQPGLDETDKEALHAADGEEKVFSPCGRDEKDDDVVSLPDDEPFPGVYTNKELGDEDGDRDQVTADAFKLLKGLCFTKAVLTEKLHDLAFGEQFCFKVRKSTKKIFVAGCRVNGCPWTIRATTAAAKEAKKGGESDIFWVRKFNTSHTCSAADRVDSEGNQSTRFLAKLYLSSVGKIEGHSTKQVRDTLKAVHGVDVTYAGAYRTLVRAQELVRGSQEEGFARLPATLHLMGTSNPGSFTKLEVDEEGRFKYVFAALYASIAGFFYLPRVVVVDGSHLTGRYKGTLLVATAQDGNNCIFPLAVAVVDTENDDSWEWFFSCLRSSIGHYTEPLAIISDRHKSIAKAVAKVFPNAHRGICYYHLQNNIVTKFKARSVLYFLKQAAYAYTLNDYNGYMDRIREYDPKVADYLEQADPLLWARVHFPGNRYLIQTSNIAESVNSTLKSAKAFPVSHLLVHVWEKLGSWFVQRRENAESLQTLHTTQVEVRMLTRIEKALRLTVQQVDRWLSSVSVTERNGTGREYKVDLQHRTCTCGVYRIEHIPCEHIIASALKRKLNLDEFVDEIYTKDNLVNAYSYRIYAQPTTTQVPPEVERKKCLPPVVKHPPGRRRKSRYLSALELSKKIKKPPRKQYSCGQCGEQGHNKLSCGARRNVKPTSTP